MRILEFVVEGQTLEKAGDFFNIVKGTKQYLKCRFNFEGNDWIGCKAVAVFEVNQNEHAIAVKTDGTCMVPDEVTDFSSFKVKVIGVKGNTKIITNKELISQEE